MRTFFLNILSLFLAIFIDTCLDQTVSQFESYEQEVTQIMAKTVGHETTDGISVEFTQAGNDVVINYEISGAYDFDNNPALLEAYEHNTATSSINYLFGSQSKNITYIAYSIFCLCPFFSINLHTQKKGNSLFCSILKTEPYWWSLEKMKQFLGDDRLYINLFGLYSSQSRVLEGVGETWHLTNDKREAMK